MRGVTRSQVVQAALAWLGLGASACPGPPPPLPELSSDDASAECGNGEVEAEEECDGANWQGATCESLGYDGGVLDCSDECRFVVQECELEGMVRVPEGEFTMGSGVENEQPIRQVTVDAFFIDETEVTVAAYAECVATGSCDSMEPPPTEELLYYNYGVAGREDHPINGVSWDGAHAYCAWVDGETKRLPTEAEWEKAARGTDARTYPWGEDDPSCDFAVMEDMTGKGCGMDSTLPIGSKPMGASPYGALDMAGNVGEWVSDWDGDYDPGDVDNPTGPEIGRQRVLRGGNWYYSVVGSFRVTYRNPVDPAFDHYTVGFRCAKTPPASP
jgi:formylglycine-generating enzyme required for sulfatase activity